MGEEPRDQYRTLGVLRHGPSGPSPTTTVVLGREVGRFLEAIPWHLRSDVRGEPLVEGVPVRVLHVMGELQASGAEVMLRNAASELARHTVESLVLSTGYETGPFAEELRSAGMTVLHLPFARSAAFGLHFFRLLREYRPDVVHIHTERANAALGILARLSGARRIVRTVHSVFAYERRLRLIRTVERALLRSAGVTHISISPSVRRNECQRLGNPSVLVDNWIAPELRPPTSEERLAARNALGVEPADLVVASIGRCVGLKNHLSIIKALKDIERATGRRVIYLHAGSGPNEQAEQRAASAARIRGETVFLGVIQDVRSLLWATDVFTMPSTYEGVGLAALEALACGTPLVLGDCEGLRDAAPESEGVRFVGTGSHEIVDAVVELAASWFGIRPSLVALAIGVKEKHDMTLNVTKLVGVYSGKDR